jgi:predicted DNA-binding protein
MDKIILPIVKPIDKKVRNIIRCDVTDETLKTLHEFSDKTGLPIQYIARRCIEAALPEVECEVME